jgi:hypothetical protein
MTILLAVQVLSLTSVAAIGIYTIRVTTRGDHTPDSTVGSLKNRGNKE